MTTDIVIADAEAPATLRPWGASGTGLWMLHKNEDLRPQHEACLFEAAFTDNVKLAQEMIDAKVDVNCRRQKGRTPLHYCALGNGALVARVRACTSVVVVDCRKYLLWGEMCDAVKSTHAARIVQRSMLMAIAVYQRRACALSRADCPELQF